MKNSWNWCWCPKELGQTASGQPSFLTTLLMASSSGLLVAAIEGTFPHTTNPGSRICVDLEVVFLVDLQSTLLEAYARSLSSLKMRTMMMKRCSSVDERPRCGYEVMIWILVSMITWCQNEVHRSRVEIMWVVTYRDHVSRSCEWIMWVVTCRDYVMGRSCDHDITYKILLVTAISVSLVLLN